jgi:O-antigen ligase
MYELDNEYSDFPAVRPAWERDYISTKRCLYILAGVLLFAVLIFILTKNALYAGGFAGFFVVLMCIVHTPFALFVLFSTLAVESVVTLSPYFTVSKVVGIIVLVSFLLMRLRRGIMLPLAVKLMLVFMVYALASSIWALNPYVTLFALISLVLQIGVLFIAVNTIKDIKNFNVMMWGFVIGATVASVLVFTVRIEYGQVHEDLSRAVLKEETNPAHLANAIIIGVMAALYLFLNCKFKLKIIIVLLVLIMLGAIIKTQSRKALIGVVFAPLLAFMFSATRENRVKYLLGAIMVCVFAFGFYQFTMRSGLLSRAAKERLMDTSHALETGGRIYIWKRAMNFISERPLLGVGYKNFPIRAGMTKHLASAHNNILSITAELGIPGLVLVIIIHICLLRSAMRISYGPLKLLALAFFFHSLIGGLATTNYSFKNIWYEFTFIIIASQISSHMEQEQVEYCMEDTNDYYYEQPEYDDCRSVRL